MTQAPTVQELKRVLRAVLHHSTCRCEACRAARALIELGTPVPAGVLARYEYAGKIGPWARHGEGRTRYLDTGLQGKPIYRRILTAGKDEDGTWRYLRVMVEGMEDRLHVWCGTNTYERTPG